MYCTRYQAQKASRYNVKLANSRKGEQALIKNVSRSLEGTVICVKWFVKLSKTLVVLKIHFLVL